MALLAALTGCGDASGTDAGPGADEAEASSGDTETETTATTDTESTDTDTTTSTTGVGEQRPERLVVTADWRAHRLSLVDHAALLAGAQTREHALWKTIELPDHEPGPLEVELTPDGTRALVAVAPGFFGGPVGSLVGAPIGSVPETGSLLVVELDTGTVLADIQTTELPMGIAIEPDGSAAWTANFGSESAPGFSVDRVDLQDFSVTAYETAERPEQIDIEATGQRLIVSCAAGQAGAVAFLDDPQGGLYTTFYLAGDPSWIFFLDDFERRAVVVRSFGGNGDSGNYTLLDVSDPIDADTLAVEDLDGIPYAGAKGLAEDEIVVTALVGAGVEVSRYHIDNGVLLQSITIPVSGFPLGVSVDAQSRTALVPLPGANALAVVDFDAGEARVLPWQDEPGPTYLALEGASP